MATKKKTDCRQYRIGDFARYLGPKISDRLAV